MAGTAFGCFQEFPCKVGLGFRVQGFRVSMRVFHLVSRVLL